MPSQAPQWLFLAALVAAVGVLRWLRRCFPLFALLILPGTFAHECCHLLLGLLLGAKPAAFNLLPRREGHGWTMGSVSFRHLVWYNVFFVGMAPLLLLPAAYALVRWRLQGQPGFDGVDALVLFLAANLIYASLPSWQDGRLAARSPIGWLLLAAGLGWAWHRLQAPPVSAPRVAGPAPHGSGA